MEKVSDKGNGSGGGSDGCDGATMSSPVLNKFKGCLVGALLGDCLGEPFQYHYTGTFPVAPFFSSVLEPDFKPPIKHRSGKLPYTDDTAQTKVLTRHLIQCGAIDTVNLGHMFTKEYYSDMRRGYGMHVPKIFKRIHENLSEDTLELARAQFDGSGSYGNGAAMRVSPVALFFYNDTKQMIEAARMSSLVTHAHKNGYNGAILQCLAIQMALNRDPASTVDPVAFVKELRSKMEEVEAKEETTDYCDQLDLMEKYLEQSTPPDVSTVVNNLGHDISALKSVPTAIFSYLMAQKPIENIEADTLFERTLHYAISLGGDTDTIASMAGAICGAHVGFDAISPHLMNVCEDHELVAQLAEKLFKKSTVESGGCFPCCK